MSSIFLYTSIHFMFDMMGDVRRNHSRVRWTGFLVIISVAAVSIEIHTSLTPSGMFVLYTFDSVRVSAPITSVKPSLALVHPT